MIQFLLSPTKTMQENLVSDRVIQPGKEIVTFLRSLSVTEIQTLMKVNQEIASQNFERFQNMKPLTTAIYGYTGLQFKQLRLSQYTEQQLRYLDEHVYILSALYGLVKPLDVIQCYRLEMQTKLPFSLYDYWKDQIFETLKAYTLVSLASDEYEKVLDEKLPYISIRFLVEKNGKQKRMATISKIARGQFLNACVEKQITNIEQLKEIVVEGFCYNAQLSSDSEYIFIKK